MEIEYLTALSSTDHARYGGSSRNLVTGETPTTGFMVSVEGFEKRVEDSLLPYSEPELFLRNANLDDFRRNNQIHDVATLGEALDLARKSHQRAIYDVAKGESIYLDDIYRTDISGWLPCQHEEIVTAGEQKGLCATCGTDPAI